ncbi:NAD(P)/FAD-dependent oxidoreductase [Rhodopseudomonas palustris]|uniref:NAD(P)/FAD-dependent oxidoreductase n=1 Tax=Rhodopseudomonas palustris TaxID=1076 RepID=UPI0021F3070C|nr:FAD-dependent oxidoreductase [Rhodopseudomonas palustris]UYO54839.1 FAD-dependent oxidoreductase [Rhodopseudomonas palustris]
MRNITIIGSGFAGLTAARELRKHRIDAAITMISPRRELHFLPSSIWIPAGIRQAERLKVPLDNFLTKHRIDFVEASATGLKDGGRIVVTERGELRNDHLIIAAGGRFIRKLPGIEHALIPCEGIKIGEEIGRRLDALKGGTIAVGFATNPNEPGAMRGGPMFEFLFIIDALLRRQRKRPGFKIVFFSPAPRPGARLGERAVDGLLQEMKNRGIATRLGRNILRFEERKVVLDGGEIDADLILFMPGLTGPAWLENTDLPLSAGGMIKADELCRVEGLPNVWVVGDAGSFPGPDWMPKQAHQADLQAIAVAANIAAIESGQQPITRFKPELVCIVDMLDSGMLVFRNQRFNFVGPKMKLFHWLKRLFERHYLTTFR